MVCSGSVGPVFVMLLWLGQINICLLEKGTHRQVEGLGYKGAYSVFDCFCVAGHVYVVVCAVPLCFPSYCGNGPVAWWMIDLNFKPFPHITTWA